MRKFFTFKKGRYFPGGRRQGPAMQLILTFGWGRKGYPMAAVLAEAGSAPLPTAVLAGVRNPSIWQGP